MKTLVLTTSYPRGEDDYGGRFVRHLVRGLAAAGVEVAVLAPAVPGAPRREREDGIPVERCRFPGAALIYRAGRGGGLPEALRRSRPAALFAVLLLLRMTAAALRRGRRYDVLHCAWFPLGAAGLAAKLLFRTRLVVNLRGSDRAFLRGAWRPAAGLIAARADAVVAVGAGLLTGLPSGSRARGLVIPNGVDVGRRRPAAGFPPAPVFLFVGSLTANKSADTLVRAAARIGGRHAFSVVIVGLGAEEAGLRALAVRVGAGDRVVFAGALPQPEVHEAMARSLALVHPSLSEGRSNVILEAQACGLAVLAADIPANRETLGREGGGLFFPPRDDGALAGRMAALLDDPEQARRLGREGRAAFEASGWTWERTAGRYLEVYRRAFRPDRRTSPNPEA